jgi:hypothetical protein
MFLVRKSWEEMVGRGGGVREEKIKWDGGGG